jgi:hypothetical protein
VPNRDVWISLGAATIRAEFPEMLPHPRYTLMHIDQRNLTKSKVSDQDRRLALKKEVRRLGRLAVSAGVYRQSIACYIAREMLDTAKLCTLNELRQLKKLKLLRERPEEFEKRFLSTGDSDAGHRGSHC